MLIKKKLIKAIPIVLQVFFCFFSFDFSVMIFSRRSNGLKLTYF